MNKIDELEMEKFESLHELWLEKDAYTDKEFKEIQLNINTSYDNRIELIASGDNDTMYEEPTHSEYLDNLEG